MSVICGIEARGYNRCAVENGMLRGPKVVFGAALFPENNRWAAASNIFDVRGSEGLEGRRDLKEHGR
jgi:hypothetical protein